MAGSDTGRGLGGIPFECRLAQRPSHSPQPWIALVSGSLVRYPMGLGSTAMQSRLCPGLSPGGWLGSQTRHSLRSLSLQLRCLSSCQPVTDLNFRSPWSARIPALPRERGEVNQPGCRCYVPKRFVATAASVVLALRLGSSFALNLIANFWLAYIRFVFGQYPKVSFSGFFSFRLIWCKTGAC